MNWLGLPNWLPWWVPILVAVPLGLWALAMIVMPFNVIGVKARLESLEAELEELHADMRTLVLRLPSAATPLTTYAVESPRPTRTDRGYAAPEPRRPEAPPNPVSPPPREPPAVNRAEPRLDWRQR